MRRRTGRPSEDYTICPDCKGRTVLFHFGRGGEDYYSCTRHGCRWNEFQEPASWDTHGRANINRWRVANGMPPEGGS